MMLSLLLGQESLKPPAPGEPVSNWLVYALMILVMAVVSGSVALNYYYAKVFVPKILSDFWAALAKKDVDHRQALDAHEQRCEARAQARSDAHRKEREEQSRRFLEALRENRETWAQVIARRWDSTEGETA